MHEELGCDIFFGGTLYYIYVHRQSWYLKASNTSTVHHMCSILQIQRSLLCSCQWPLCLWSPELTESWNTETVRNIRRCCGGKPGWSLRLKKGIYFRQCTHAVMLRRIAKVPVYYVMSLFKVRFPQRCVFRSSFLLLITEYIRHIWTLCLCGLRVQHQMLADWHFAIWMERFGPNFSLQAFAYWT